MPPTLHVTQSKLPVLRRVVKDYEVPGGRRHVLRGLDFDVDPVGCTTILGPNGCGKSTLLRTMLGLESPDSGEIAIHQHAADLTGAVMQDYRAQLVTTLSARTNLLVAVGGRHDLKLRTEVALRFASTLLGRLGFDIDLSRPTHTLSGGEQQGLVFVRALLSRPRFWVLDEPASAIDFSRRRRVLEVIWTRSLRRPTIMSTHDINDAILVAKRVVVFDGQMQVVLDEELPRRTECSLRDRLVQPWASALRERLTDITHA